MKLKLGLDESCCTDNNQHYCPRFLVRICQVWYRVPLYNAVNSLLAFTQVVLIGEFGS